MYIGCRLIKSFETNSDFKNLYKDIIHNAYMN